MLASRKDATKQVGTLVARRTAHRIPTVLYGLLSRKGRPGLYEALAHKAEELQYGNWKLVGAPHEYSCLVGEPGRIIKGRNVRHHSGRPVSRLFERSSRPAIMNHSDFSNPRTVSCWIQER